MKITKKLGERLEQLLEVMGYEVRHGRGNFRGGVCLLDEQRLVVLNQYYPLESRIQSLIDLVVELPADEAPLSPEQRQFLEQLRQFTPSLPASLAR